MYVCVYIYIYLYIYIIYKNKERNKMRRCGAYMKAALVKGRPGAC